MRGPYDSTGFSPITAPRVEPRADARDALMARAARVRSSSVDPIYTTVRLPVSRFTTNSTTAMTSSTWMMPPATLNANPAARTRAAIRSGSRASFFPPGRSCPHSADINSRATRLNPCSRPRPHTATGNAADAALWPRQRIDTCARHQARSSRQPHGSGASGRARRLSRRDTCDPVQFRFRAATLPFCDLRQRCARHVQTATAIPVSDSGMNAKDWRTHVHRRRAAPAVDRAALHGREALQYSLPVCGPVGGPDRSRPTKCARSAGSWTTRVSRPSLRTRAI